MTVPPARQCTLPDCDEEAVNPERKGALCQTHLDSLDDGEPVKESEESPQSEGDDSPYQETDTSPSEPLAVESGVYPVDLIDIEEWLTWKETDDGRKVPRAPWTGGGPATFVSAQDPEVWTDSRLSWSGARSCPASSPPSTSAIATSTPARSAS